MSVVSTKYNCIHVHIPKTAGTSIRQILGGGGHSTIKELHQFIPRNTDIDWDSLFKFAIVRNPWDRMISCMFHGPTPEYKFDHVLDELLVAQKKDDWSEHWIFRPQWHWTHLTNGIYAEGKGMMDFIGKFEALPQVWADIAEEIGAPKELPHANKGTHRDPKVYLTPERLEKTQKIYEKDYKLFNYVIE